MTVTALYAGLLGLWFLVLSYRVVQQRQTGIGLGDGGNEDMLRRIRGHANFAEYTPMCLILIGLAEYQGASSWLIHVLGGALLLARLLHGYAFAFTAQFQFGRFHGTLLTFIILLVSSLLLLWQQFA